MQSSAICLVGSEIAILKIILENITEEDKKLQALYKIPKS
jgi:hypothetical protein